MTEESERFEIWQQQAKHFLQDKSANELFGITVLMLAATDFEDAGGTYGRYELVLHDYLEEHALLSIEVARMMLASSNDMVRKEAYWIAEPFVFSHHDAANIVWALLDDSSDQVSSSVMSLFQERFNNADTDADAPLRVLVEAASHLADAKRRHQK